MTRTAPTKILHVIHGMTVGGAELDLLRKLQGFRNGYNLDHTVCCLMRRGPFAKAVEGTGVRVIGPFMSHRLDPAGPIKLAGLLKQSWDLIHSHMYQSNLVTAVALSTIPTAARPRFIASDHMMAERHTAASLSACKFIAGKAELFLLPSKTALESYKARGLDPRKLKVQANVLAPISEIVKKQDERLKIQQSLGLEADTKLVGTVCRLEQIKAVDVLLRAVQDLAVHLVVVGDGSERQSLETLALELGVQDRVHFLGFRDDARNLIAGLDLFVSSSTSESFGLAILEALAMGTPVVSTNVGAAREVLGGGSVGLLVPPGNSIAMKDAIQQAVSGQTAASVEAGRRAAEAYLPDRVLPQLYKLYLNE